MAGGGGGPAFLPEDELTAAERFGAALTPASARPRRCRRASPKRRRGWGETAPTTRAAPDGAAGGRPGGAVVRAVDRRRIAKLRFADHRKALGVNGPKRGGRGRRG